MNQKDLDAIDAAKRHAAASRAREDVWRRLIDKTRQEIAAASRDLPERVPISTVVATLIMEMASAVATPGAAFGGAARALAAMAISQDLSEEQLIEALTKAWAPTFRAGEEMREAGVIAELRAQRNDH